MRALITLLLLLTACNNIEVGPFVECEIPQDCADLADDGSQADDWVCDETYCYASVQDD